jgi:hypothetical protein
MNDFTKEELIALESFVKTEFKDIRAIPEVLCVILVKVMLMIGNYCDHEKVVPNYDCKTQCEKCGKIL